MEIQRYSVGEQSDGFYSIYSDKVLIASDLPKDAKKAFEALIAGEWDNKKLYAIGPLFPDKIMNIKSIVSHYGGTMSDSYKDYTEEDDWTKDYSKERDHESYTDLDEAN